MSSFLTFVIGAGSTVIATVILKVIFDWYKGRQATVGDARTMRSFFFGRPGNPDLNLEAETGWVASVDKRLKDFNTRMEALEGEVAKIPKRGES